MESPHADEPMVDSWSIQRKEILSALMDIPRDVRHPWEGNPSISLTPILMYHDYATPLRREERKLAFIPRIQELDGKVFTSIAELVAFKDRLQKEIWGHNEKTREAISGSENRVHLAEAHLKVGGVTFRIALFQYGDTNKLELVLHSVH
jgi:hypothetical protein